jgi:DNA-binding beta-propeller fold protein YncE
MRTKALPLLLVSALLMGASAARAAQAPAFMLVGLDGKTFFDPAGGRNGPNGADAIAFIDVRDEAHPQVATTMLLDNSVYGPPTNLQITPDGRLGLVASSVTMRQEGAKEGEPKEGEAKVGGNPDRPWYAQPDDRLHVLDLTTDPPQLVETITVGRQPSGLAINGAGDLALVANREGKSVTVLSIAGTKVTPIGTVDVGDEAASVAISPNGQRAFVAKNKAGTIGVLKIEGTTVTYDPAQDMPVGAGVYGIEVTPDARLALTANTGATPSDGNADSVSVIDANLGTPKVVDWLGVGDTPESIDIAPDGRHAALAVVRGSAAPQSSPNYGPKGLAVLLSIDSDGSVHVTGAAEAGAVPQGVAFSPSGRFVYVGNYVDRNLQVFRVEGDALVATGIKLQLPGQPASLRGRARG